jgi:hypothetical protein
MNNSFYSPRPDAITNANSSNNNSKLASEMNTSVSFENVGELVGANEPTANNPATLSADYNNQEYNNSIEARNIDSNGNQENHNFNV